MVTSALLADIANRDVEQPLRSSLGWVATDAREPGLVLGLAAALTHRQQPWPLEDRDA
jgi:hypothetical protein